MSTAQVFPDWVFTGDLPIASGVPELLMADLETFKKNNTVYGYETVKNKLSQNYFSLSKLMGTEFYDKAVSHFRLPPELRNVESVDSKITCVKPGHTVPLCVNRHRWYQGAIFLSDNIKGSDIYLELLDSKLYATPPGVQEYTHTITGKQFKMAFWPAHLPWGFTANQSNSNTYVYTTSFIIKRD